MKTKITLLLILFVSFVASASTQTMRNAAGNNIGKIESDGTVRNSSGNRIGKVETNGTIRNANGNRIGKVNNGDQQKVGAIYFFFFFK